jgi:hypothetical protein
LPIMMGTRKHCKHCYPLGTRSYTSTKCCACDNWLCLNQGRNCFYEFHVKLLGGQNGLPATPITRQMTCIPSEEISRTPLRSISALIQNEQSSGASGASSVATPTVARKRIRYF